MVLAEGVFAGVRCNVQRLRRNIGEGRVHCTGSACDCCCNVLVGSKAGEGCCQATPPAACRDHRTSSDIESNGCACQRPVAFGDKVSNKHVNVTHTQCDRFLKWMRNRGVH